MRADCEMKIFWSQTINGWRRGRSTIPSMEEWDFPTNLTIKDDEEKSHPPLPMKKPKILKQI